MADDLRDAPALLRLKGGPLQLDQIAATNISRADLKVDRSSVEIPMQD